MLKQVFLLLCCVVISVMSVGCSSKNKDIVPDKTPVELFDSANQAMASENFSTARDYLESIDSRYPFGPYAHQVQLNLIYTYYKERENDLALAEIDKFIRLNPSDPNIDYLYYMRGLTLMQKGTDRMLQFLYIDTYDRDNTDYEQAFAEFKKVATVYPKSLYVADSIARMIYIRNAIARHELDIAKFYYKRQAYISSARRCQKIVTLFKDTDEVEDALKLLRKNYQHLNLTEAENNTQRLLDLNFAKNKNLENL